MERLLNDTVHHIRWYLYSMYFSVTNIPIKRLENGLAYSFRPDLPHYLLLKQSTQEVDPKPMNRPVQLVEVRIQISLQVVYWDWQLMTWLIIVFHH